MPSSPLRAFNDAVTAIQLKDSALAKARCEELVAVGADGEQHLVALGNLCIEQGDTTLARYCFERAIELNPRSELGLVGLALTLEALGKRADAITSLRRAVDVAPNSPLALNNLGSSLLDRGQTKEAVEVLDRAARAAPDFFATHYNLGRAQAALGRREAAIEAFDAALRIDPTNPQCRIDRRELVCAAVPRWHFPMMNDEIRNDAYRRALRKAIKPGMHVLDIGTGAGLLAMMAAQAGASRVTSCEVSPLVAKKAAKIIEANGFAGQIRVLNTFSTCIDPNAEMGGRADLLVSEVLSADVVREGVVRTMSHARRHLIAHGAPIIPRATSAVIAPLCSSPLEADCRVETAAGFDLTPFNDFVPKKVFLRINDYAHRLLGPPVEALRFDFASARAAPAATTVKLRCTHEGRCLGLVQWIRIELDEEVRYENSPSHQGPCCWQQVVYPFPDIVDVDPGDTLKISAFEQERSLHFLLESHERAQGGPHAVPRATHPQRT